MRFTKGAEHTFESFFGSKTSHLGFFSHLFDMLMQGLQPLQLGFLMNAERFSRGPVVSEGRHVWNLLSDGRVSPSSSSASFSSFGTRREGPFSAAALSLTDGGY